MKSKIKRMLLVTTAVATVLFLRTGFPVFDIQNIMLDEISSDKLNMMKWHIVIGMSYDTLLQKVLQRDNKAILTLFTTFKESHNKYYIHRKTIRNWGLLSPDVLPVLFIDPNVPTDVVDYARQSKWNIFPVPNEQVWYSDISPHISRSTTIDRNLTDTIYELIRRKKIFNNMLVIGRRRNWKIKWQQHVSKLEEIGHYAKSAKLSMPFSHDYFISTRNGYPWSTIPDFVVGRNAYDNWLVTTALTKKIPLVDATETITALHQSDSQGDREGVKTKNG